MKQPEKSRGNPREPDCPHGRGPAGGPVRRDGEPDGSLRGRGGEGFWVCWVLKQLFSIEAFSGRLLFKGGTSLSKIFRAITGFPRISIWRWITPRWASPASAIRAGRACREPNRPSSLPKCSAIARD